MVVATRLGFISPQPPLQWHKRVSRGRGIMEGMRAGRVIAGLTSQEGSPEESSAPGNARGLGWRRLGYGKCHRDKTASAGGIGDRLKEKPSAGLPQPRRLVRVKRWGKSPPRQQQCWRHGKPRAVQGQIGGEGWPGPLEPSGRLLEPSSD